VTQDSAVNPSDFFRLEGRDFVGGYLLTWLAPTVLLIPTGENYAMLPIAQGRSQRLCVDSEVPSSKSKGASTIFSVSRCASYCVICVLDHGDLELIAALCSAPARGTPRKWPENCLKIEGREVLLWDVAIEEPCFTVCLRFNE
jgi:hypothetical protein